MVCKVSCRRLGNEVGCAAASLCSSSGAGKAQARTGPAAASWEDVKPDYAGFLERQYYFGLVFDVFL